MYMYRKLHRHVARRSMAVDGAERFRMYRDPHPGNIAVDSRGSLIFYDFGMMGEIKADVRENLLEVFYGVYEKDADRVLDALITLGVIKLKSGDRTSLRRCVQIEAILIVSVQIVVLFI
jgi:predicted unusual protein kinase regulating ubiquinone biosynthesis (AarF/ABC1/UbiB family)